MCGISGIVAQDANRFRPALDCMVESIQHRGPDGKGIHFFSNCGLGHTRLAIIDLTTGQQPMESPDGSVAVTFNGEIYGYQELRNRLNNYPFRTSSDTEVILALYERYGPEMLPYLPGMFTFAIWDNNRQQLVCGRDRFGEKPLYYARGKDGAFVFASEVKAILASGLVDAKIGQHELVRYLRRGYPAPDGSIYSNIHALPPAHYLVYRNGNIKIQPYWQLPPMQTNISLSEAAASLQDLFGQAISRQLVADVPVGALLSGGLDSTTVVAAARQSKPDLKTFSFDFLGGHSEIEYARAVAKEQGTEHLELRADSVQVADLLLRMQHVYDEPFFDSSNIATFLLCELVSEHTKVALTGDGADELLGGYPWYRYYPLAENHPRFLFWKWTIARIIARSARTLKLDSYRRHEEKNIRLKLQNEYPRVEQAHEHSMSILRDQDLIALGIKAAPPANITSTLYQDNSVDAALRNDVVDYMPGDILFKTDRASMAHGLELRAPFLDTDLAEFCISLPPDFKVTSHSDKLILRSAFADTWPSIVRERVKQGFGAPIGNWLSRPDMKELSTELLGNNHSNLYDYLDYSGAQQFLASASNMQIWLLLNLAAWLNLNTSKQ